MNFQGKLMRHGRVVLDHVAGSVSPPAGPEDAARFGDLRLQPRVLLPGGPYVLQLDGGPALLISVSGVSSDHQLPAMATFTSTGPMS